MRSRPCLRFLSYVAREDPEALYRLCVCFAFASTREGFGIPILEAMARDAPVVCASASVPAEVAGGAAVLVDPASSTAIADGILRLLGDPAPAGRLAAAGRERVTAFLWDRTIDLLVGSLGRAVAERAARRA